VVARFHDGRPLLDVAGSRAAYRDSLGRAISKGDAAVLAWCLMSTHVHLVLRLGRSPIGEILRSAHTAWAARLNRGAGRSGAALAGRPLTVLCEDGLLLELLRYVHNNPVRARLVARPHESPWTSHRALCGLEPAPSWLDADAVLGAFGADRAAARAGFDTFVNETRRARRCPSLVGELPRSGIRRLRTLTGGLYDPNHPILGSDDFVVRATALRHGPEDATHRPGPASRAGIRDVIRAVEAGLRLTEGALAGVGRSREVSRGRRLVARIWCELLGGDQRSVAESLGIRQPAVSAGLRAGRQRRSADDDAVEHRVLARLLDGEP
jgi:REP element-mobilizing transposase RayT